VIEKRRRNTTMNTKREDSENGKGKEAKDRE